ncbi:MAG: hypothetical protein ACJAS1_005785 [Oleiphilaceae bacterium]|jgi:hypothetical protein
MSNVNKLIELSYPLTIFLSKNENPLMLDPNQNVTQKCSTIRGKILEYILQYEPDVIGGPLTVLAYPYDYIDLTEIPEETSIDQVLVAEEFDFHSSTFSRRRERLTPTYWNKDLTRMVYGKTQESRKQLIKLIDRERLETAGYNLRINSKLRLANPPEEKLIPLITESEKNDLKNHLRSLAEKKYGTITGITEQRINEIVGWICAGWLRVKNFVDNVLKKKKQRKLIEYFFGEQKFSEDIKNIERNLFGYPSDENGNNGVNCRGSMLTATGLYPCRPVRRQSQYKKVKLNIKKFCDKNFSLKQPSTNIRLNKQVNSLPGQLNKLARELYPDGGGENACIAIILIFISTHCSEQYTDLLKVLLRGLSCKYDILNEHKISFTQKKSTSKITTIFQHDNVKINIAVLSELVDKPVNKLREMETAPVNVEEILLSSTSNKIPKLAESENDNDTFHILYVFQSRAKFDGSVITKIGISEITDCANLDEITREKLQNTTEKRLRNYLSFFKDLDVTSMINIDLLLFGRTKNIKKLEFLVKKACVEQRFKTVKQHCLDNKLPIKPSGLAKEAWLVEKELVTDNVIRNLNDLRVYSESESVNQIESKYYVFSFINDTHRMESDTMLCIYIYMLDQLKEELYLDAKENLRLLAVDFGYEYVNFEVWREWFNTSNLEFLGNKPRDLLGSKAGINTLCEKYINSNPFERVS